MPDETPTDLSKLIASSLNDSRTGWSMGSFGAIAEFHHVEGDPGALWTDAFARVTSRGGVAFTGSITPSGGIQRSAVPPLSH